MDSLVTNPDPLLSSADVGQILGVTPEAVRKMVQAGRLVPDEQTPSGFRLFRQSTVERLAAQRAEQRRQRTPRGGRPPKAPRNANETGGSGSKK